MQQHDKLENQRERQHNHDDCVNAQNNYRAAIQNYVETTIRALIDEAKNVPVKGGDLAILHKERAGLVSAFQRAKLHFGDDVRRQIDEYLSLPEIDLSDDAFAHDKAFLEASYKLTNTGESAATTVRQKWQTAIADRPDWAMLKAITETMVKEIRYCLAVESPRPSSEEADYQTLVGTVRRNVEALRKAFRKPIIGVLTTCVLLVIGAAWLFENGIFHSKSETAAPIVLNRTTQGGAPVLVQNSPNVSIYITQNGANPETASDVAKERNIRNIDFRFMGTHLPLVDVLEVLRVC